MNVRQIQKEKTKEKIMGNAYYVYAKEGFTATTEQIAKLSEVSHGTIFSHFSKKEDLIVEVINQFGEELTTKYHELSEETASLEEMLHWHIDILIEYEDFYTNVIKEKDFLPKEVQLAILSMNTGAAHHFLQILEKNDVVEIESSFIFNSWMAILHYYLLNRELFAPEGSVLERYKEKIIKSFLMMIRKEN